jgi:hypothetical protein
MPQGGPAHGQGVVEDRTAASRKSALWERTPIRNARRPHPQAAGSSEGASDAALSRFAHASDIPRGAIVASNRSLVSLNNTNRAGVDVFLVLFDEEALMRGTTEGGTSAALHGRPLGTLAPYRQGSIVKKLQIYACF